MEERMKVGQIVWVKLRGYPWWPAVIDKVFPKKTQSLEQQVLVKFIGDLTESTIAMSKLKTFDENYDELSKTKKKNLINAIEIAKKINDGEMTYTQHYKMCKNGGKTVINNPQPPTIGVKRPRNEPKITSNIGALNTLIEDFIYAKRNMKSEEENEEDFFKIKKGIISTKITSNSLNLLIKLYRYLSCSRNFVNEITKKKYYLQLKEVIKDKVIETLFDENSLELNILEDKEGKYDQKMCNLLEAIDTIAALESISPLPSSSISLVSKNNNECESFINLSSESKTDYDDLKTKITIMPLNDKGLIDILSPYSHNDNNNNSAEEYIKTIIKSPSSIGEKVHCPYLRKRVCCKLYGVFQILFKNTNIDNEMIKNLCLHLENNAREKDSNMSVKYKDEIIQIFRKIKNHFI